MSSRNSKTVSDSIEETREYHARYLRAINNPLRREILKALKEEHATIEQLQSITGLGKGALKWNLDILENGFCVEKDDKEGKLVYRLTQEGKVVDYLQ